MKRSTFLAGAAIVLVVAGGAYVARSRFGLLGGAGGPPAAGAPPAAMAMPVPVTGVVKKTISITLEYSARTDSIQSIPLQAKVAGFVQAQLAPDGADVKKGDLLYKIDPRDYQAALDQANAQAQRDTAALDYARANAKRGTELGHAGYLARDTVEQRSSTAEQAQAALVADQAAIRTAKLNLDYTDIRAPFDGRLGRNQAPVGSLITIAGATLNTLVEIDPLYVTFNPSETDLVTIQKAKRKTSGDVEVDVYTPGDEAGKHKGKLTFLDNTVDRSTGTITARATIENASKSWLPGQYVRVRLILGQQPDALLVPQAALGSGQLGKYLYVVGKDNKVEQRFVSMGQTDGEMVEITKGVSENDQVITGNLQKIGPGAPVKPMAPSS